MLAGLIDNILRGDADEKVRRLRGWGPFDLCVVTRQMRSWNWDR